MITKTIVRSLVVAVVFVQVTTWCYSAEPNALEQAKASIQALIKEGKYDQAQAATEKLKSDFVSDSQLPAALNFIAGEYRWVEDYNRATAAYRQVAEKYANNPAGQRARLGLAEIEIITLLDAKDFAASKQAFDKMKADFESSGDLPETMYWMSQEFDRWGRYDTTRDIYQEIMSRWPNFKYIDTVRFEWRCMEPFSLADAGKDAECFAAVDRFIADFREHPDTPGVLLSLGWKYYADARAEGYQQKAIALYDKVMTDLPKTEAVMKLYPDVYYHKALCYTKMREYPKALSCYEKIVSDYPDFVYAWYAQFMVGLTCEDMKHKWLLTPAEADVKTKAAYEAVIAKYPTCPTAANAEAWLKLYNSKSLKATEK